jgi:hypothetical protein
MLTNWVPRAEPGAKVIQLGGGTRELYYYPKNALQVTIVGEGVNKSLLEQAGVQAAVPTLARAQPPWDLAFAPDASVRVSSFWLLWRSGGWRDLDDETNAKQRHVCNNRFGVPALELHKTQP